MNRGNTKIPTPKAGPTALAVGIARVYCIGQCAGWGAHNIGKATVSRVLVLDSRQHRTDAQTTGKKRKGERRSLGTAVISFLNQHPRKFKIDFGRSRSKIIFIKESYKQLKGN